MRGERKEGKRESTADEVSTTWKGVRRSGAERVGFEEEKDERLSLDVSIVDRSEWEFRITQAKGIRVERGKFDSELQCELESFIHADCT